MRQVLSLVIVTAISLVPLGAQTPSAPATLSQRIVHTDQFEGPDLPPGEMRVTVTLRKVFCGTDLNITQEGVPAVIPLEACYLGWQESLVLLGQLVEAQVSG